MEMNNAISALAALAQESRLKVFRMLVNKGQEGIPAGEIARTLGIPGNTLSSHLGILSRAGLIGSRRQGRSIIYFADMEGTRALMSFLMEDCCGGNPDLCGVELNRSGCRENA